MAETKDFYFKLFAREYLTSGEVRALPLEAQGILPRLWCVCCLEGSMPADLEELSIAAGVKVSHLRSHMRSLMRFFCEGPDGQLFSRRMEREREARLKVSAGAVKAAKARYDKEKARPDLPKGHAIADPFADPFAPAVNSTEPHTQKKEAAIAASSPAVLILPCKGVGKQGWPVTEADLTKWAEAFPRVDPLAEARKMKLWLEGSPTRQKTFAGTPRFALSWLGRAQNDPRTPSQGATHAGTQTHRFAGRDAALLAQISGPPLPEVPSAHDQVDPWEA